MKVKAMAYMPIHTPAGVFVPFAYFDATIALRADGGISLTVGAPDAAVIWTFHYDSPEACGRSWLVVIAGNPPH